MERKREKEEILYGLRPVMEAIDAGKEIERVLIQKGLKGRGFADLYQALKNQQIPYQFVPIEKLNRITRANHQGILAFSSQIEYHTIESILPAIFEKGEVPLIVVLDRITDVRNAGAIARTALCAGAHAMIVPLHGSARMNADAVKTSAGALHTLPVHRANVLKDTLLYLRQCGLRLLAASEKANMQYDEANMRDPLAIIMGSEEDGISADIIRLADDLVKIPVQGPVGSLNVSVATGVLLYEAVRQRSR